MESLLVGDTDCSFNYLVNEIGNHECLGEIDESWETLARHLDTPPHDIRNLQRSIRLGNKGILDVISVLLEKWRASRASEAKFVTLLDILDNGCNWKAIADRLRTKVAVKHVHQYRIQNALGYEIGNNIRRFITPPIHVTEFQENDELLALVVQTDNVGLTCTRFNETVTNASIYTSNEFLKLISTLPLPTVANEHIFVVLCENNLKQIQSLLTDSVGKCIFITEKLDAISTHPKLKVVKDNFVWDDLSPIFKSEIQNKCKQLIGLSLEKCVDILPKVEHSILLEIIHDKFPTILRESIPEHIVYYIPRQIRTRNVLDNNLYHYEGSDIFFIHGIDRLKLSNLVNGKPTDTSSNFLFQSFDFTTKFVILEELSHFELIVNKHKHKSIAMHLISYDHGKLVWKKSTGEIKTIQKYVSNNQSTLSEKEIFKDFLNNSISDSIICISDAPGMGKSILLAHFASKLRDLKTCNPLSVCFVTISELAEKFVAIKDIDSPNDQITSAMARCLCTNELGLAYFEHYQHEIKDIVLDGLDELSSKVCDGYELIKLLQRKFSQSKLWVATRPHLLLGLERALNVIGYNIEAFDNNDQIMFLEKYWSRNMNPLSNKEKLRYFAKKCLSQLKETISTESDCDVAGIPLQCLLIGDVFEDELKIFLCSGKNYPPIIGIKSMTDLYERLVKKKYEQFFKRYDNKGLDELILTSAHVNLSFSLLFPKFQSLHKEIFNDPGLCMEDILNVGILQASGDISAPRFIHRTFAEYFLAKYIVEFLQTNCSSVQFKFLFGQVFETLPTSIQAQKATIMTRYFKNDVICYFVDALLRNTNDEITLKIEDNTNKSNIDTDLLTNIGEACVYRNFESVFFHIVYKLAILQNIESSAIDTKLLILCTLCSSKSFATNIYRKFGLSSNKNITFSDIVFNHKTLLHYAVGRGEYEIFDMILCQQNFYDKLKSADKSLSDIIHSCVEDTFMLDELTVKNKCEIIKRLHTIDPNLLLQPNDKNLPIFCSNVHTNLLMTLLELGTKSYNRDSLVQMLHTAVYSCDSNLYMQIVEYVQNIYPEDTKYILNKSFQGYSLIERVLMKLNPVDKRMLDYLKEWGVVFDSKMEDEHSILHLAIEKNISLTVLKWLLSHLTISQKQLNNSFWFAHKCQNFEFLKLVIQLKRISPNIHDVSGFTSLHRICGAASNISRPIPITFTQLDYIKLLLENGAKINIQNKLFHRTNKPSGFLLELMPSPHGFQVIDLLRKELSPEERAFRKWKWLINWDKIDELTFRDCADICLKDIGDLNKKDRDGNTFLHIVAKFHNSKALKYLLARSVNVNVSLDNKKGEAPLHLAIKNLNLEQFKMLDCQDLKRLIDYLCNNCESKIINFFCAWYVLVMKESLSEITVDCGSKGKCSLLEFAISKRDGDILEYFVKDESCTNKLKAFDSNWIHAFLSKGNADEERVKFLGLVIQICDNLLNTKNEDGHVSLSFQGIYWRWVNPLVRLGANVNASDACGNTPLHWAFKHKSENLEYLVKELVECGADVNSVNQDNESPIFLAAKSGNCESVILIVQHNEFKLDPQIFQNVLICIVYSCDLKTIKFVSDWYTRETGIPINKVSGEFEGRQTAILDIALLRWEAPILEYFINEQECTEMKEAFENAYDKLKRQPDGNDVKCISLVKEICPKFLNTPNEIGLVPLSIKGIDVEWVKHLVDLGADVNHPDSEGNTPLHWALKHNKWNFKELVVKLVEMGADVNAETYNQETPLTLALDSSDQLHMYSCLKYLLIGKADVRRQDNRGDTILHLLPPKLVSHIVSADSKATQFHKILEIVLMKNYGDVLQTCGSDNLTPIQIAQKHFTLQEKTLKLLTMHKII